MPTGAEGSDPLRLFFDANTWVALAALGSFWFAIYSWNRSRLSELFRAVRPEMIEIVQNFNRVFLLIDARSFYMIETIASREIRARLPVDCTVEEFKAALTAQDALKSFNRGVISAVGQLNSLKESREVLARNRQLAAKHRQLLPVLCDIADDFCSFSEFVLTQMSDASDVHDYLGNDDQAQRHFLDRVDKAKDVDAACLVLAELYVDYSGVASASSQVMLRRFASLIGFMAQTLASRDDRMLQAASRKLAAIAKQPFKADDKSYLIDILNRTDLLKPVFGQEEWIQVVKLQSDAKHSTG